MDAKQIDILLGKANPYEAKCCLLFELDEMLERYVGAWERVGVILPIL